MDLTVQPGAKGPPVFPYNPRDVIPLPGLSDGRINFACYPVKESHGPAIWTAWAEHGFKRAELSAVFAQDHFAAGVIFRGDLLAVEAHNHGSPAIRCAVDIFRS